MKNETPQAHEATKHFDLKFEDVEPVKIEVHVKK